MDGGSKDKKENSTKKCVIKKTEIWKLWNTTELVNKIDYLEKSKIDIDSIKNIKKNL